MHPILASEPNQIIGAGSILMLGLTCILVVKIKKDGGARALCLLLLCIGLAIAVAGTWNVWRPFGSPWRFAETELCQYSPQFRQWEQRRARAAYLAAVQSGKIKPRELMFSPVCKKYVAVTNAPQYAVYCFLAHPMTTDFP